MSPFRDLLAQRQAIEIFVARDIRARYVNSVLGMWWTVVQPVALLAIYTFVFTQVLGSRFSETGGTGEFARYLFCGLLPWLAFADAATRASSIVIDQAPLIKKVVFPSEILPVHVVLSGLAVELVGLAAFLVVLVAWGHPPGAALLVLPVVMVLQFLFTTGVAWLVATVAVFVRDVRHVVALVLTLWMFVTPIVYPIDLVPERFAWVLWLNPMTYLVEAYRATVLDGVVPGLASLGTFGVIAVVTYVTGHGVFTRAKPTFADVL